MRLYIKLSDADTVQRDRETIITICVCARASACARVCVRTYIVRGTCYVVRTFKTWRPDKKLVKYTMVKVLKRESCEVF